MPAPITGASLLARMLAAYGVTHVFFMDAVLRRLLAELDDSSIERVLGHSEAGVAYMADGFARVASRPAVCMAQSVGAANLGAALQDAFLAHSAVVAFTGRHAAAMQYRNAYQEIAHDPPYGAVTKFNARVETLEQIPLLVRQAFREATTGTPRPVHLDFAGYTGDALMGLEGDLEPLVDEAHARYPAFRPAPDPLAIDRAAKAIARAVRPVIVADRGVVVSGAGAALAQLAQRVQALVVCTPDAKDAMLEHDPLFRGIVGYYGRSCANRLVHAADLVVFAGSTTSDHTTAGWKLPAPGAAIVQIDLDPAEIGRNFPGVIGVQADVRAALEALASAAPALQHERWLADSAKELASWRAECEPACASAQVPMRPERICRELSDALPPDAIVFSDTGNAAILSANHLELRHPQQRYFRAGGSLGWAFPAALGGKCAAPESPVVCLTGDGGFFYHLVELETARRRGINTVTVVNNNQSLSQGLRNIRTAHGGRDGKRMDELYVYRKTDFAQLARTFDCFGATVERPEHFRGAFESALAAGVPAVIDVKTEFAAQVATPWIPA